MKVYRLCNKDESSVYDVQNLKAKIDEILIGDNDAKRIKFFDDISKKLKYQ